MSFFRTLSVWAVSLWVGSVTQLAVSQEDHSSHQAGSYQGHDMPLPPADDVGRRRMGMDMRDMLNDEVIDGLKEKISLYRALTDNELRINVAQMGENYSWYVSTADLKGDVGVIILSHGVSDAGDRIMMDSVRPLAYEYPTAVGFGMAMMTSSHLQAAIEDLEAAGVKTIILVPTTSTVYNSMTRQWQYILGLSDEASYLAVKPVETNARLIFAPSMNDASL